MGQVAFDTQEFVETLENAGLPKDQARAISIAVRKSHEVADVATKRDLEDVRKEIDARFDKVDARFEKHEAQMQARFEKHEAQMQARFEKHEAQMQARFEKTDAKIADVRKNMEHRFEKVELQILDVRKDISMVSKDLLFKLGGLIVTLFGIGIAIMKFL